MLRFGKNKLVDGFTKQDLVDHLTNTGYNINQVNNTVDLYFSNYFAFNTIRPQIHFLKPNGYFDLLQIDNTIESRRQSKNANTIATIAIIISGLLALSTILMTIFYVPTVKIEDIKQEKNISNTKSQYHDTIRNEVKK
jgi:ABC-type multidrug transport system permease subunit